MGEGVREGRGEGVREGGGRREGGREGGREGERGREREGERKKLSLEAKYITGYRSILPRNLIFMVFAKTVCLQKNIFQTTVP